jgi:hypothetical protein
MHCWTIICFPSAACLFLGGRRVKEHILFFWVSGILGQMTLCSSIRSPVQNGILRKYGAKSFSIPIDQCCGSSSRHRCFLHLGPDRGSIFYIYRIRYVFGEIFLLVQYLQNLSSVIFYEMGNYLKTHQPPDGRIRPQKSYFFSRLKGIVSRDWKGLQMVSFDRFEV